MSLNPTVTIRIDRLTLRRGTVYDRAKLRVYLEACRVLKKKAEFDELAVSEEELRLAVQELCDGESAAWCARAETLTRKLAQAHSENESLT
jgi:hypothetical protein